MPEIKGEADLLCHTQVSRGTDYVNVIQRCSVYMLLVKTKLKRKA